MAASADSPRISGASQPPSIPRPVATTTPAYSLVSEKLRRVSAGSLQCALFCGGPRCKYEHGTRYHIGGRKQRKLWRVYSRTGPPRISSPWPDLRPFCFREHDLIDQFKRSVRLPHDIIGVNSVAHAVLICAAWKVVISSYRIEWTTS